MSLHQIIPFPPAFFLVTSPEDPVCEVLSTVSAALSGGVTHVVLRRPNLPAGTLFQLAMDILTEIREVGHGQLIVHDRADVAMAMDAHGVHVPGVGLPVDVARRVLGGQRTLGISIHDLANADVGRDADYAFFGHVYETVSHSGQAGRGLDRLREVCERAPVPVIAIGGITVDRIDAVLAAGASGIAVIRAISRASDPEGAARELRHALDAFHSSSLYSREDMI